MSRFFFYKYGFPLICTTVKDLYLKGCICAAVARHFRLYNEPNSCVNVLLNAVLTYIIRVGKNTS